jgi:hypothetical protein
MFSLIECRRIGDSEEANQGSYKEVNGALEQAEGTAGSRISIQEAIEV